ncbi:MULTISPECIES: DUF3703 domain-containing protein [unclassified Acidovorax]|uniref:DUF3703 domain-containing protein n=1 Tax=unclassified Acidovorax TaxID=2684926 RepID=UPI0009E919FE|nr:MULTISPECIES: DUF3703 domain-containing protein [unclassified Acidovorax]
MRVHLSTRLEAPPAWVARQLQSTAVFRHITAPLMRFKPTDGASWPTEWTAGELKLQMWLLGVVPLGSQTVRIAIEPPPQAQPGHWPTLWDHGDGALMRRWDHRITLQALPDGATLYTDDIDVVPRHMPWLMTPLSAVFARWFFVHRQRRWRALAATLAAQAPAPGAAAPSPGDRHRAVDDLLHGFASASEAPPAMRWQWLEAAHVLGQNSLHLHWRSHLAMLRYAWALRDLRECLGQLLRLALVPLGHLLARLPAGNTGRAHVNAFKPMAPADEMAALIDLALSGALRPPPTGGA